MSLFTKGLVATLMLMFFSFSAQAGGPKLQDFPEIRWEEPEPEMKYLIVHVELPYVFYLNDDELDKNELKEKNDLKAIRYAYATFFNYDEKHDDNQKLRLLLKQTIKIPAHMELVQLSLTNESGQELFSSEGEFFNNEIYLSLNHNTVRRQVLEIQTEENLFIDSDSTAMVEFENGIQKRGYFLPLINGKSILTMNDYENETFWDITNMPKKIIYNDLFDEKNIITIDSINADFIAKSTVAPLMNLSLNSNIGEFLKQGELKTFFGRLDEGTCSKVSVTGMDIVIGINGRTLDEGFFKDGGELFEICSGFRLENKIIGNRFYMEKEIMEFSIKGWSPEDYGRVVLEITPEQNTNNLLDGLLGEMVPSGLPILSLPIE